MKTDNSLILKTIINLANSLNEQCVVIDKENEIVFVNEILIKDNIHLDTLNTNSNLKIVFVANSQGQIRVNNIIKACFELKLSGSEDYKLLILFDSKQQYKQDVCLSYQMFDFIPDILAVHDLNFNVLYCNTVGLDFLKLKKNEEIGEKCYNLIGRTSECDNCPAKRSMKTGNIVQTTRYFPDFKKWFDIRAYPIKDENNNVWRVIEHLRDVTIHKENEIKLHDIEEQRSRLIGNIPGIVYRCKTDKFWTMIFMSQETLNITGYTSGDFISNNKLTYNEIIHPDDRKHVYSEIKKSTSINHNFIIEYRIITRKNEVKFVWEKGKVVTNSNGEEYIDGVIIDITDRKKAEIELAVNEEKYRLLVQNQNDLIIKVDKHGRITFANENYCNVFGKTEEELLNKNFMSLVHEEDKEMTSKTMAKLLLFPHTCYIEQRAITVNGWRWLAWSDKAILNETNEIIEIIGVGRDITEKKIHELALKNARDKAEHDEKRKSEFISNACKNLKLPIDSIISASYKINDEKSNSILYGDVLKSALTINSLIDGFSDIVLANKKVVNQEKFDLNEVFTSLFDIYKNDAYSQNIKFNFIKVAETSSVIIADKTKIHHIILHLLSNSFNNTVESEISVGYNINKEKLILFVKDNSKTSNTMSLGDFNAVTKDTVCDTVENLEQIDLILAKLYAEYLGGCMKIIKGEGGSTEFYVEIPVNQFSPNNMSMNESSLPNIDLSSITVLVAEDEKINFHLIKTILTKAGATVIGAISGTEAIERVKQDKNISIVFMDIKMPGISGSEALFEIKKIRHNLPVIACTAYTKLEDLDNFVESDFDGFLPKPINRNELFNIINDIINKKPE